MAVVGIALRGLGLLAKNKAARKAGDKALKRFKKIINKTPNKQFKHVLDSGKTKTGGAKQKKKIIKQQISIKRKMDAKGEEYTSPIKQ